MEGHHAVEEQEILALGYDFSLTVVGNEHWKLSQVCPSEIPDAFFGTCFKFKSLF